MAQQPQKTNGIRSDAGQKADSALSMAVEMDRLLADLEITRKERERWHDLYLEAQEAATQMKHQRDAARADHESAERFIDDLGRAHDKAISALYTIAVMINTAQRIGVDQSHALPEMIADLARNWKDLALPHLPIDPPV